MKQRDLFDRPERFDAEPPLKRFQREAVPVARRHARRAALDRSPPCQCGYCTAAAIYRGIIR
jgi:hypothetical protein